MPSVECIYDKNESDNAPDTGIEPDRMSYASSSPETVEQFRYAGKDMLAGLSQAGISLFLALLVSPFEVTNVVATFNLQVS